MIRLETSKRTGISNHFCSEVQVGALRLFKTFEKERPRVIRRTEPSSAFNCHGLTFAGRRTHISDPRQVQRCLTDDDWKVIIDREALPGDIVVYFDESGDPNHSGIVVWQDELLHVPRICSKWGFAGEYIHLTYDVPPEYGPEVRFYRCCL